MRDAKQIFDLMVASAATCGPVLNPGPPKRLEDMGFCAIGSPPKREKFDKRSCRQGRRSKKK